MDQAMLLVQEPCENKATNFPSGELRVSLPGFNQPGSNGEVSTRHVMAPGQASANSDTKNHRVRVTGAGQGQ